MVTVMDFMPGSKFLQKRRDIKLHHLDRNENFLKVLFVTHEPVALAFFIYYQSFFIYYQSLWGYADGTFILKH